MSKYNNIIGWDFETAGLDPSKPIYSMAVNINPNFKQYQKYRKKYDFQDLIIFIDNGNDEYELFNEDAKIASNILSTTLKHNEGYISASIKKDELSNALKALIRNGYRAAVHEPVKTNKKQPSPNCSNNNKLYSFEYNK